MYIIYIDVCNYKFCTKIYDLIIEYFFVQEYIRYCKDTSSFSQICWKDSYEC